MSTSSAENAPSSTCYQPTTPAQQTHFIAGMLAHGNLARAIRDAGIGSRTTGYRLWRHFCATGEAVRAPRSHARTTPPPLAAALIAEIRATREAHPLWGRRRMAQHLAAIHGHQVVSPSSVQAVLEQAGLWSSCAARPVPAILPVRRAGHEALVAAAQLGILRDVQHAPQAAIAHLEREVWGVLATDPTWRDALLREPEAGSWLLRSLPYLAHALIDIGRWFSAYRYLQFAYDWMISHPISRQEAIYQETTLFAATEDGWRGLTTDHPPLGGVMSLRRGDSWVECNQYLGVVLRDNRGGLALDHLLAARRPFAPESRWPVEPSKAANYRGVIEHDLAAHKLHRLTRGVRQFDDREVARHLDLARSLLEQSGSSGMLAAVATAKARWHAHRAGRAQHENNCAWRGELAAMASALEVARHYAAQEPSPILRTTAALAAADLLLRHGMGADIDTQRLRQAARDCLTHGYRHQAHQLINLPLRDSLLPPELRADLMRLLKVDESV